MTNTEAPKSLPSVESVCSRRVRYVDGRAGVVQSTFGRPGDMELVVALDGGGYLVDLSLEDVVFLD